MKIFSVRGIVTKANSKEFFVKWIDGGVSTEQQDNPANITQGSRQCLILAALILAIRQVYLTTAKIFGKNFIFEELKAMRSSCAFQDEIDAGSSKIYSKVINSNHSSNFN